MCNQSNKLSLVCREVSVQRICQRLSVTLEKRPSFALIYYLRWSNARAWPALSCFVSRLHETKPDSHRVTFEFIRLRCGNRAIQSNQWCPGLERFRTFDRGWGVKTNSPVSEGMLPLIMLCALSCFRTVVVLTVLILSKQACFPWQSHLLLFLRSVKMVACRVVDLFCFSCT